jgi:uncharacterized membrane protein
MAQSKQAKRRSAVSAKKKAPHGGARSRAAVNTMTIASPGTGRSGGAVFNGAARGSSIAAEPESTDPSFAAPATGLGGWVRQHPLQLVTWIISLFGLGVSIYLTIAHYDTGVSLACPDTGVINCAKVTSSTQSVVFGIFPVAVLGLAFYVFMAAINSPWGWRLNRPDVNWLRLGSVIVGMGFVIYLVFAEVVQIGNICLWCTSVHVATFLLFALLVYQGTTWNSTATAQAS